MRLQLRDTGHEADDALVHLLGRKTRRDVLRAVDVPGLDLEQERGQMRIAINSGDTNTSDLVASLRERLPECEFSYVNLESTL